MWLYTSHDEECQDDFHMKDWLAFSSIDLVHWTAHGAVLSGMIANRILHLGATLTGFKVEIAVVVVFVLCLVFVPLLLFAPQLAQAVVSAGNEKVLETLIRYADEQGLMAKKMTIAEMFVQIDEPQS